MPAGISDPYSAAAGAVFGITGTVLSGLAADKRRKQLRELARTPGLNIGGIYGEALGSQLGALPQAQSLVGAENVYNLKQLQDLYETSIPGFAEMQRTRAGQTAAMLRGEIPADVASQVYRGAAGRALAGGYAGSPAFRNLTARDLGLTSLDLIRQGQTGMESLIRSTPMPRILQTQDLLNIDPMDVLGLRSKERAQYLSMMGGALNAPTAMDVWGKQLQDVGGGLAGIGTSGGSFGSGLGRRTASGPHTEYPLEEG